MTQRSTNCTPIVSDKTLRKSYADTIQAQSARIEELTKALEDLVVSCTPKAHQSGITVRPTMIILNAAKLALSPTPTNGKDTE